MSVFKKVARPFQLPELVAPRRIIPVGQKEPENLILDVGGHGNIKKMSGSESYSWHGYMKRKTTEKEPVDRGSHVTRIFGRTKNPTGGDPIENKDIWLDVRRMNKVTTIAHNPIVGQETKLQLALWDDHYLGNPDPIDPDLKTKELKITNPEDPPADPKNPDEWIPLKIIEQFGTKEHNPITGQDAVFVNNNKKPAEGEKDHRKVRKVRVLHVDLSDALDTRLEEEPIDAKDYERDEDAETDRDNYLDYEVIITHNDKSHNPVIGQETEHTWNNKDDPILSKFEDAPEGADPLRLDQYQHPVNVNWGDDVWALIWVSARGLASVSQITAVDWEGDPAGTIVNINTNADILYERNEVITDDPAVQGAPVGSTWHAKIIYGSFQISTADSTYNYKVFDGLTIPLPAVFHSDTGFYVGPFVNVYNADDPVDMARYAAKLIETQTAGVFLGTMDATVTSPTIEAVWLLEWNGTAAKNRRFEISTSGFGASGSVWLYPKKKLKVDRENKKYGAFGLGAEPGSIDEQSGRPATNVYQRVYFPINWKNDPPPFPKSPGGRDWPWPADNYMLNPADPTDVVNAAMFEIAYGFDGADPHWEFKVEKRHHWSSQPGSPVDPTLRDRMWQVWPTDVDPPAAEFTRNDWGVARYTMKPFGEVFPAPASWQQVRTGEATFDSPSSPLPLIPPETAG